MTGDIFFIVGTIILFITDKLVKKATGQSIPGIIYWPIQASIFAAAVVIALINSANKLI